MTHDPRAGRHGEGRPISPPPHHVRVADTRYALGNNDAAKIDFVRLGESEGAPI